MSQYVEKIREERFSLFSTKTIFFTLLSLMILSFIFYIFFIGQTVFRLVERKNIEQNQRLVSTELSSLELEILDLNNMVSIKEAFNMGFVETKTTSFVTRQESVSLR